MGKYVEFISITLDPLHDTGPVLQEYAKKYGSDMDIKQVEKNIHSLY